MDTHFAYTLKDPIFITSKGEKLEADNLIVNGPRPSDDIFSMSFEGLSGRLLMRGFKEIGNIGDGYQTSSTDEKEESEEDKIESLMKVIKMGLDEKDTIKILYYTKELLTEGNKERPQSTLNGEKMTKPMFDGLSTRDKTSIIGRYMYHFLSLASV